MRTRLANLLPVFMLVAAGPVSAQQPTVYASGLNSPSKIILGPSGSLLVAENGTTPNSGRVSLIAAGGTRRTLIDGLPSGLAAPNNDPDGTNGLLLKGNTLYIAVGEGDTFVNGTKQGTSLVNPAGPSSAIFDSILQVDFSKSVDGILTGFTMQSADAGTLLDGSTVNWTNASGDKAAVTLLSTFRYRPDPVAIYRNSHPYGLAQLDSDSGHIYMNDAGLNSVVQIDTQTGRAKTVVHFANVPNLGTSGPPTAEAVPDSIRAYGNQVLVTFLSGFPFTAGDSKVVQLDPATGTFTPFINYLASTIDIAWRPHSPRPQFFVLEYSSNMAATPPASGRVVVFNTPDGTVLADNLTTPTSLALDASAGILYIATQNDGKILQLNVGQ